MCGMIRMKLMALLALALVAGATRAATETVNGVTYTYTVSDSAAWISTLSMSKSGGVTVPSQLGGYPVKSIGTAFYENEMIRTVKLPNGITSLSSQAFMKCINLSSITLPDGLESLGYKSFYRCEKLVSIKLPPSVKNMGDRCFAGCRSLTSVNIPNGITYLPTGLFCGCSSLASISVPSSVTSIGEIAFGGNWQWWDDNVYHDSLRSLTSVEFHEGLVSIGKNAFCYCSQVKSFNIPCTVTTLGDFAFNGCYEAVMTFNAAPPSGATNSSILNTKSILYPKEFGSAWATIVGIDHFGGYAENKQAIQIVSSSIRKNNPTVLDVVYKVTSKKPTVKVRALAFEDGERSFAKVTRPETFVADANGVATAGNVGDWG